MRLTNTLWDNVGARTEGFNGYKKSGSALTDTQLVLAYSGRKSGNPDVNRWAKVEISSLLKKDGHASSISQYSLHKINPLLFSFEKSREIFIVEGTGSSPCAQLNVEGHLCLVRGETQVVGSLPVLGDSGEYELLRVAIDNPPSLKYQKAWAYPILIPLTPVTIAADITLNILFLVGVGAIAILFYDY